MKIWFKFLYFKLHIEKNDQFLKIYNFYTIGPIIKCFTILETSECEKSGPGDNMLSKWPAHPKRSAKKKSSDNIKGLLATYSCDKCEYKATQKGNLKTHIASIHSKVTYSCENKSNLKLILKTHIESIHSKITYSCDLCK